MKTNHKKKKTSKEMVAGGKTSLTKGGRRLTEAGEIHIGESVEREER